MSVRRKINVHTLCEYCATGAVIYVLPATEHLSDVTDDKRRKNPYMGLLSETGVAAIHQSIRILHLYLSRI